MAMPIDCAGLRGAGFVLTLRHAWVLAQHPGLECVVRKAAKAVRKLPKYKPSAASLAMRPIDRVLLRLPYP